MKSLRRKLEKFGTEHYAAAITIASVAYVASLLGGLLVALS